MKPNFIQVGNDCYIHNTHAFGPKVLTVIVLEINTAHQTVLVRGLDPIINSNFGAHCQ